MADPIQHFVITARAYCEQVESHAQATCGELLAGLFQTLPALLAAGHSLPSVGADADSYPIGIEDREWQRMYAGLSSLLGRLNNYATRDPYAFDDDDLLVGALADDLADLWRDLSSGLRALDAGANVEAVVWAWRVSLQSHWGMHAADAIRVLQYLHSRHAVDGFPESSESIADGIGEDYRRSRPSSEGPGEVSFGEAVSIISSRVGESHIFAFASAPEVSATTILVSGDLLSAEHVSEGIEWDGQGEVERFDTDVWAFSISGSPNTATFHLRAETFERIEISPGGATIHFASRDGWQIQVSCTEKIR